MSDQLPRVRDEIITSKNHLAAGSEDIILEADIRENGAIAQLGERRVRNAKVAGSIPAGSIKT